MSNFRLRGAFSCRMLCVLHWSTPSPTPTPTPTPGLNPIPTPIPAQAAIDALLFLQPLDTSTAMYYLLETTNPWMVCALISAEMHVGIELNAYCSQSAPHFSPFSSPVRTGNQHCENGCVTKLNHQPLAVVLAPTIHCLFCRRNTRLFFVLSFPATVASMRLHTGRLLRGKQSSVAFLLACLVINEPTSPASLPHPEILGDNLSR